MLRSLFSGVSGLRNHQTRLDVISNNIANVNTVGFKGSRVTFRDMLSQTISGASAPEGGRGGINPMQVGVGMGIGSIDSIMTQGNPESTGRNTDLAIEGDGFFLLGDDNGGTYYTRAGGFSLDTNGNLINAGNGLKVKGWTAVSGTLDPVNSAVGFIQVQRGQEMPPSATGNVAYIGNLDSRSNIGDSLDLKKTIYDSQGNTRQLTIHFVKNAANTWDWSIPAASNPDFTAIAGTASGTIGFTAGGAFDPTAAVPAIPPNPTATLTAAGGVAPMSVTLDMSAFTQYASTATAAAGDQDGYSRGSLSEFNMDTSGVVTGYYSNGRSRALAQIALAGFNNPEGLERYGDTMFQESNNSGTAQVGTALTGGRGTLKPGSLEMSNVDLAQEFTNLIITQRGFQANSRVITTSDEVLQELVGLKR